MKVLSSKKEYNKDSTKKKLQLSTAMRHPSCSRGKRQDDDLSTTKDNFLDQPGK